jgi:hypothetical protein
MTQAMQDLSHEHVQRMEELSASWGWFTGGFPRNVLQDGTSVDVEVLKVTEFDDKGEVFFGHPDQVELYVVIINGTLILSEILSEIGASVSKAGVYIFERKVRFYEKRHNRKADRLVIVCPIVDDRAKKLAKELNIEVYGSVERVPL